MRTLAFTVALVLGAVITWLLTVRRVSEPQGTTVVLDGTAEPEAQSASAEAFGGERTPVADTEGAAGRWSRSAQDEDALLDRSGPAPRDTRPEDQGPTEVSREGHD